MCKPTEKIPDVTEPTSDEFWQGKFVFNKCQVHHLSCQLFDYHLIWISRMHHREPIELSNFFFFFANFVIFPHTPPSPTLLFMFYIFSPYQKLKNEVLFLYFY